MDTASRIATEPVSLPLMEDRPATDAPKLAPYIMALFFIFGGITSLNDVIIPKLKDLFTLSHMEAMLIQSAFFGAYFLVSIPGAAVVRRLGYMRGGVVGLLLMLTGCLLFIPASQTALFPLFLFALFILASRVTIVQVVANPLISILGPKATAHSRLTFAQAFNSLGTTVFPYVGAILILGGLATVDATKLEGAALSAFRAAETRVIIHAYLGLALVLFVIVAVMWLSRNRLQGERHEDTSLLASFGLLRDRRFALGTASIFAYVGAEVAIGSVIVNYLMQNHVMGLAEEAAGKLIPLYGAGALIGRFIGSAVLRRVSPGKVLAFNGMGAALLVLLSTHSEGTLAGYSLLAVGLMNSILFPTIFSLASESLGPRAAEGSGVICMAIVGGAVVPPLTGHLADITGSLATALLLPALCYAAIACFGIYARHPALPVGTDRA